MRAATTLVVACVLLGGCYSLPESIGHGGKPLGPGTAIVVGSVTQTSDGHPSKFHSRVSFYFEDVDGNRRLRLDSAEPDAYPFKGDPDRGLEALNGRLFAFELPPGRYRLVRFKIVDQPRPELAFPTPVEFDARAGRAIYLGNLDAAFCIRHAYANQAGIAGVLLSVHDRADRDLPLLGEKFKLLRNLPVERQLLDHAAVRRESAPLARQCECWRNC